MGNQMQIRRSVWVLASVLLAAAGGSAQAADPALNILFYGNSFTSQVNVPWLVQEVAVAAGKPSPNVVNAAVFGQALSYHIASNTAVISGAGQSGKWDYVVLQEYSTKPTDISGLGNPTGFKNDAQTLYGLVKANSAKAKAVLFETWARNPNDAAELTSFYPTQTAGKSAPYLDAANKMQAELRQYYGEAQEQIGTAAATLAPAGDAIQSLGFDSSLYNSDLYHESDKGGLLAALVLYEAIYSANAQQLSYSAMDSTLTLSNYGIGDAAAWGTLTSAAAAAVPEPVSMSLCVAIGGTLLLRRRCAAAS